MNAPDLLVTIIFHDFPWPTIKFHDFPGLENEILEFHDFPGFQSSMQTLKEILVSITTLNKISPYSLLD